MRTIIFHGGGFGDFFVCFKALFAIKQLYPQDRLIAYHAGIERAFMQKVGFIDELIDLNEVSLEQVRAIKPDVFITAQRSGAFFRRLKKLGFKKIVVQPHFVSVTSRAFTTPMPYFRGKKYMADIHLKLVRAINPKHYDANIGKIDFSRMGDFLPRDESLVRPFLQSVNFPYKKLIAINAFSNFKESLGLNFFPKDWIRIAFELARMHPEFLFVLVNFKRNVVQFNINETQNVVFTNSDSIAFLTSLSAHYDYLITIDTGAVHLCSVLQVPCFVLTEKVAKYRFCDVAGGGGTPFVVAPGWQKDYQRVLNAFIAGASKKLGELA